MLGQKYDLPSQKCGMSASLSYDSIVRVSPSLDKELLNKMYQ